MRAGDVQVGDSYHSTDGVMVVEEVQHDKFDAGLAVRFRVSKGDDSMWTGWIIAKTELAATRRGN